VVEPHPAAMTAAGTTTSSQARPSTAVIRAT
jgi:hypothetical protein